MPQNEVSVLVGIDTKMGVKEAKEYVRAHDKMAKAADKTTVHTKKAEKSMNKMAKTAGKLGSALKLVGFGGLGIVLLGATKKALDFDKAMTEVSTLIDKSFDPTNRLTTVVRNLSKEFAQSPVDQAKALYQVISAGASSAAQATMTLTAANKLAVGGVTDVATAADGLTSILNAYGLGAEEATRVSDTMFVAMRAGKTTIAELSASVGLLAPIAAATGVSIEEMFGAVAALTKGGLSTSMAMTGLRQALVNVLKPNKQGAAAAKQLGIEFNSTALKAQGLTGFMANLIDKAEGNTDALVALFGSVEGLNAMMALTAKTGAEDFNKILDDMAGGITGLIGQYKLVTADSDSLKMAIQSLIAPSVEAMEATKDLGFAFSAAAAEEVGFAKFMEEVTRVVGDDEKKMKDLFGTVEAYNEAMKQAASDGGAGFLAIIEAVGNQMGETEIAVAKVTESIEFQAKQVKAQLTDAMLGLGDSILTVLGPAIRGLNAHFDTVRKVAVAAITAIAGAYMTKLVMAVGATTIAFVTNTAAAIATATAYMGVTGAAARLSVALTVLRGTLVGATGGIGLVVVAIAAAISGLIGWIATSEDAGNAAGRLRDDMAGVEEAFKEMNEEVQKATLYKGIENLGGYEEALREAEQALKDLEASRDSAMQQGHDEGSFAAEIIDATGDILAAKEAIDLQSEALFRQASAAEGSVAATARLQIMINGLSPAYARWRREAELTAEARAEEERQSAALQAQLNMENHIVAGLTKVQQRRWSQLAKNVTAQIDLDRRYAEDLQIMEISHELETKAAEGTTKAMWDLGEAKAKLLQDYKEDKEALTGATAAMKKAQKAGDAYAKMMRTLKGQMDPAVKSQNELIEKILEFSKTATEAGVAGKEYAEAMQDVVDAHNAKQLKAGVELLEDLRAGNDEVAQAVLAHARAVDDLEASNAFLALSDEERLEALRLQKELHEENIKTLKEQCDANKEVRECTEDSVTRMETAWKRGWENIQDSFADAFQNMLSGGEDVFDGILDAFKSMIANMIATWAASGIAELFKGGGLSGFGAFNPGGIFGEEGTLRNPTSILGNVAAGIAGVGAGMAMGEIFGGGKKESTVGSVVGAVVGSFIPVIGTFLGGILGGALGGVLFGGEEKIKKFGVNLGVSEGGIVGETFQDIKRSGGLLRSSKRFTRTSDLDSELEQDLNSTLKEAFGSIMNVAEALGVATDAFDTFNQAEQRIDLKGLSDEEVQQVLQEFLVDTIGASIRHFIDNTEGLSDRLKATVNMFRSNTEDMIRAFELAAQIDFALSIEPLVAGAELLAGQSRTLAEIYEIQKDELAALLETVGSY